MNRAFDRTGPVGPAVSQCSGGFCGMAIGIVVLSLFLLGVDCDLTRHGMHDVIETRVTGLYA